MSIGFDYGTSNCSVAKMVDDAVSRIPLSDDNYYIPSSLCAPTRESVSEHLFRNLNIRPATDVGEGLLRNAILKNKEEGIYLSSDDVKFGDQARALYLEDPTENYYVKSPKSFLGILGLNPMRLAVFEDLVCAMMANVKRRVEAHLQNDVSEAVIGRPVNFHNRGGEEANQQALGILTRAATRAGFKHIEFQFEPVAAGLDFESRLEKDHVVLVVDVGGGTTDCSLLHMGPNWIGKADRTSSMIGHAGKFVGGNDLDIALAFKKFMPEFGKDSETLNNRPIPTMLFWEAVAINDVEAQKNFYAYTHHKALLQLVKDAKDPVKVKRITRVYQDTLSHSIVQSAENTKIALGNTSTDTAMIDLKNEVLNVPVTASQLREAIETPLGKIRSLIEESLKQAGTKPDTVYITGGSAKSPILRQAIESVIPNVPIASGDFDGSVTSGLARWADVCFK